MVDGFYTDSFRHNKQVSLSALRDFGMGKNLMETRIMTEVDYLLSILADSEKQPFNPDTAITASVSNIITSIIFSKRYAHDDPRFQTGLELLRGVISGFLAVLPIELFPPLRFLPSMKKIFKTTLDYDIKLAEFMREEIEEHQRNRCPEDHDSDFINTCEHKLGQDIDPEMLLFIIRDFFAAGTDTTATTLKWSLIYMAKSPDVQRRVHYVIDDVIGRERLATLRDRADMPYIEAVLLEIMRKSSIVPNAIPHETMCPATVNGFHIREGAMVRRKHYLNHISLETFILNAQYSYVIIIINRNYMTNI